jgi:nitrite reductase (NADH) large subunit
MEPYVIVGNGAAGVNAIEAIRATDTATPIVQFSDEEAAFYSRPALYSILLGKITEEQARGRPADFSSRHGVDFRAGTRIATLEPRAHRVVTAAGEHVRYSRLLLATGARGRRLPWVDRSIHGVVMLNTLADVTAIATVLPAARRAVVVGGGLTSIELVEVFRHHGLTTTFVMWEDHLLATQLTEEEGAVARDLMTAMGVTVRSNEEIRSLHAENGRVVGAVTREGEEIPCEAIACAVGVVPNKELAQAAGLEVAEGVLADGALQTTAPDVYAAGDAAQVRTADGTVHAQQLLWYVAGDMGKTAGANVAGGQEEYRPRVLLTMSQFAGTSFCSIGAVAPDQPDVETRVVREEGQSRARLVMQEGRLVGACFIGSARLATLVRHLIEEGARPSELPSDHPVRTLFEASSD